jgi:hypothetical protein
LLPAAPARLFGKRDRRWDWVRLLLQEFAERSSQSIEASQKVLDLIP